MMLSAQQPHSAHASSERHGVKELFASLKRLRSRSSPPSREDKPLPLPPTPASSPFPSPRPPSPPSPQHSPPLQPIQRPTPTRSQSTTSYTDTWSASYHSGRLDFDPSPPLFHEQETYMPPTPPLELARPRSGISFTSTASSRGSSPLTTSLPFGPLTTEPRPYGLATPAAEGRERFSMLETVTEGQPLQQEASAEQLKWEMEALARGRRPSLALSVESCPNDLTRSDVAPLALRRGSLGLSATFSPASPITISVPSTITSCFDITTQQCAELLNLDFVALLAISNNSESIPTLSVLSSHNMPIPPPLYNVAAHLDILQQGTHAVAYTSSIPSNGSEFASGLLLKVKSSSVQDMGFLLVGYSFSDCQHTLEELSGMEHFARDIRVGLDKL